MNKIKVRATNKEDNKMKIYVCKDCKHYDSSNNWNATRKDAISDAVLTCPECDSKKLPLEIQLLIV